MNVSSLEARSIGRCLSRSADMPMTCFCQEADVASQDIALYIFQEVSLLWGGMTSPLLQLRNTMGSTWRTLTSHNETPNDTIMSPGSAMLGSCSMLERKQFMVSKNLFLPSAKSRSS